MLCPPDTPVLFLRTTAHRSTAHRTPSMAGALLAAALLAPACHQNSSSGSPPRGAAAGADRSSSEPEGRPPFQRGAALRDASLPLSQIRLPAGFEIRLFAGHVENARSLSLSPAGTLYVGTRESDKVHALVDDDGDGRADRHYLIAEGLETPNGVRWHRGSLYVAEIERVLRYDDIDARLDRPPEPKVVVSGLPADRHHGWKFIAIGPDDRLYVPVGAPCNVCKREDPRYASLLRMGLDGSGQEVFAHGIRNTVGFDWQPQTGALWFTENGRDRLGNDTPPDELNRAGASGLHFGFPHCHAGSVLDPELGRKGDCERFEPPAMDLAPHTAALGMRFYGAERFPEAYRGQVFIAEHGSWNREEKIGYRVTRVRIEGERAVEYAPFAEGWLQPGEQVWGRPVDVEVARDGALLVSDDHANAIYRIDYRAP